MARNLSRMRAFGAAMAGLLFVGSLVACGSDSSDDAGDGAKGPIKIMDITTVTGGAPLPENPIAAQAAVDAINEAGGINGRQLELTICDDKYDPNVGVACARQASEDGIVAMVGGNTTFDGVFEALDRDGIAAIGGLGTAPAERTVDIGFPLSGAQPGYTYGAADSLAREGVTKGVFFGCDIPACVDAGNIFTTAMEARSIDVRIVTAPPQQADYAAAAATVAKDGTDGVFIASFPQDLPKMISALRQVGYDGVIASYSTLATQASITAMGDDAEGLLIIGAVTPTADTSNAGITEFLADLDAANSEVPGEDMGDIGVTAWASVQLFAQLVDGMDDISAESVLDAMNNLDEPIDVGVTAPYSVVGKTSPVSDSPRIFNPTMVYSKVVNGAIVPEPGFVDPFEAN